MSYITNLCDVVLLALFKLALTIKLYQLKAFRMENFKQLAMCVLNLVMHVHKQLANVLWSFQGWICSKNVIVLLVLYKKKYICVCRMPKCERKYLFTSKWHSFYFYDTWLQFVVDLIVGRKELTINKWKAKQSATFLNKRLMSNVT